MLDYNDKKENDKKKLICSIEKSVKIFVSHRIDYKAHLVDCPIYVPIRCGAVFDDNPLNDIAGDNTGDNISDKRLTFCEGTVLYWAWKNIKDLDYYGFCHYRRYLSFSETNYPLDFLSQIFEPRYSKRHIDKYNWNEKNISQFVSQYDLVSNYPLDVRIVDRNSNSTVLDHLTRHATRLASNDIEVLKTVIKQLYPEYYEDTLNYFSGHFHLGFNCFVMSKELLNKYCTFLFEILFVLEKQVDITNYSQQKSRYIGYMSECLFSIFYFHIKKTGYYKLEERPIVKYSDIEDHDYSAIYENINNKICVATYVKQNYYSLGALINSISINASADKEYIIYIFAQDLSINFKRLINEFCCKDNIKIVLYDINDSEFDIENFEDFKANAEKLLPVFLPYILKNANDIIYISPDCVVNTDVSELLKIDYAKKLLCAAADIYRIGLCSHYIDFKANKWPVPIFHIPLITINEPVDDYYLKTIKVNKYYQIANTALLLLNANGIRQKFSIDNMVKSLKELNFDQKDFDIINALFANQINFLKQEWCVTASRENYLEYCLLCAPAEMYNDYCAAVKKPKIINWYGILKPWTATEIKLEQYFWKYFKGTAFYDIFIISSFEQISEMITEPYKNANKRGILRKVADSIFPIGSRRRESIKKILFILVGRKYVKPDFVIEREQKRSEKLKNKHQHKENMKSIKTVKHSKVGEDK